MCGWPEHIEWFSSSPMMVFRLNPAASGMRFTATRCCVALSSASMTTLVPPLKHETSNWMREGQQSFYARTSGGGQSRCSEQVSSMPAGLTAIS